MLLGNFYKKTKRPQDAIAAYRDALARDHRASERTVQPGAGLQGRRPSRRSARRLRACARARSEERQGAVAARRPVDAQGRFGARRGRSSPTALERKVDEHRLLLKLGESRIEAKRFDEAERALKAALEKKPGLALAHFDLGLVYEGQGQIDKAIASYEAELSANPKAYRAAFNAAKLLQKSGRSREAVAHFRKVVEIEPTFGTGQLYLAKALLDAGDLAGAEQWARAGLTEQARAEDGAARPLRARGCLRTTGAGRRCPAGDRGGETARTRRVGACLRRISTSQRRR